MCLLHLRWQSHVKIKAISAIIIIIIIIIIGQQFTIINSIKHTMGDKPLMFIMADKTIITGSDDKTIISGSDVYFHWMSATNVIKVEKKETNFTTYRWIWKLRTSRGLQTSSDTEDDDQIGEYNINAFTV